MEWVSQNWVWVLFAVGMIAMHLFGHGSHGGHGGHCGPGGQRHGEPDEAGSAGRDDRGAAQGSGHPH